MRDFARLQTQCFQIACERLMNLFFARCEVTDFHETTCIGIHNFSVVSYALVEAVIGEELDVVEYFVC